MISSVFVYILCTYITYSYNMCVVYIFRSVEISWWYFLDFLITWMMSRKSDFQTVTFLFTYFVSFSFIIMFYCHWFRPMSGSGPTSCTYWNPSELTSSRSTKNKMRFCLYYNSRYLYLDVVFSCVCENFIKVKINK